MSYHKRFSGDWIKRLGDGTKESQAKMQEAIDALWPYTQELFEMNAFEKEALENQVGVNLPELKEAYDEQVGQVLQEATLKIPENPYFHKGGKEGIHTEHMGYLLSDLQYMQRTYPNMNW